MNQDMLIEKLKEYYLSGCKKPLPNVEKGIRESLSTQREEERIAIMRDVFGIQVIGKRILEIGSGLGTFNIVCQQNGGDCYGIEPDSVKVGISLDRLDNAGVRRKILRSVGEDLPFGDRTFDLVVSFQVLEHTQIPEKVMRETVRVLKPGGYIHFVVPNYNSFWEGHYGIIWLPQFPRSLAKIYLRCTGRDADFLDEIQYTTPSRIVKAFAGEKVEILNLGIDMWEKRLETAAFSTWGSTGIMMKLTKIVHRLKLIPVVKYLGRKLEFYYPIILVARKLG
ncbi:MAG: class I SAM-dependent methyltransferase [Candidatus Poribacteria bacterium]|nr:class I SAM-dependent methyltransferase [Candidatus Poribacteria bacterium]